jgi:hypothetical protein
MAPMLRVIQIQSAKIDRLTEVLRVHKADRNAYEVDIPFVQNPPIRLNSDALTYMSAFTKA